MKKFFVTFNIPRAAIQEWMAKVSEEERTKQNNEMMESWKKWMTDHESSIVDKGLPLGKTKRVTSDGVTDSANDLNWYLVIEAESHEAAAEMFKDNPHLQIPTSYIEVMGTAGPGM